MIDFRKFRRAYKENQDLCREALKQLFETKDYDQAFKYCLYISDQIRLNQTELPPEYISLLQKHSASLLQTLEACSLPQSRKLVVFTRHPSQSVRNIIRNIDRQYFDPILVIFNRTNEARALKNDLKSYHLPCRLEDNFTSIQQQIELQQQILIEEDAGTILLYGNKADIDFQIINQLHYDKVISCHDFAPIDNPRQLILDELKPGFWNDNLELPSFRKLTVFSCWNYDAIPDAVLEYSQESSQVCLLTDKPLELFQPLEEELIQNFSFCSSASEIDLLMKNCREVLTLSEGLEDSLALARKHGCDLKNINTGRKWLYESLVEKFNCGRKLKVKVNEFTKKKSNHRKKLPRLLLFQHDHSVPIIKAISDDIFSALRNLGVDVMRIDISRLEQALHQKDFPKLESLRADILAKIKSFKPDQALGYNAFGIFPSGDSHLLAKLGIPYNGLFFDNPFYSSAITNNCPDKDMIRIFCLDNSLIPILKEGGFHESHYFPIATSAQRFTRKVNNNITDTDLLFTATVKPHRPLHDIANSCPSEADKDFVNFAYPQIITGNVNLHNLLNSYHNIKGKAEYPKDFKAFFDTWFHMDNQGSSKLRLKLVETLKDFKMTIYGGDNWQKVKLSPHHTYKGYLNYDLLPATSQKAQLTLCSTPVNIIDGIQQRILDCGAMQSAILSDYRPVLEQHFELDKELYVYRSFEELQEKTAFLLKNESAKEKAIKALYKKVMKEHTWEVRISQFLDKI